MTMPDKRQSNPCGRLGRPWGFQDDEAPRFQDNRYIKVIRSSAVRIGRLYLSVNTPGTHFFRPQCHSATGRTISKKNSNDDAR